MMNIEKTKNTPIVSVIIPTYNRAHLIGKAIQSVLNQTYQDFEIIVVDDGSTDNTEEVVKSFNDGRIKYIKDKRNKGPASARNTGIKVACGGYIAFQDSDGEWLPEKLEEQMKFFQSAPMKVGVVYTGFWSIKGNDKTYEPSKKITPKEGDIHNNILESRFIDTPAAVVRRECFRKVGLFDEELPKLEDWELWIRISKYFQFRYIDKPLMISYYTPGGVNEQGGFIQVKTLKLILQRHFEDIKKERKLLARHYINIADALCLNGKIRQGRRYLIKAIITYPLNIKFSLAALISLFGQRTYKRVRENQQKIRCWWLKKG